MLDIFTSSFEELMAFITLGHNYSKFIDSTVFKLLQIIVQVQFRFNQGM